MDFARQGDVNLKKIDKLPSGLIKQKGTTVARGEDTGHHHTIYKVDTNTVVNMYKDSINKMYIEVKEGKAILKHQEHKEVTLVPGIFEINIERERDPFLESVVRVQD